MTDAGEAIQYGHGGMGGMDVLSSWLIPTNATRVDVTVVLQKTRMVDFLVKPTD